MPKNGVLCSITHVPFLTQEGRSFFWSLWTLQIFFLLLLILTDFIIKKRKKKYCLKSKKLQRQMSVRSLTHIIIYQLSFLQKRMERENIDIELKRPSKVQFFRLLRSFVSSTSKVIKLENDVRKPQFN